MVLQVPISTPTRRPFIDKKGLRSRTGVFQIFTRTRQHPKPVRLRLLHPNRCFNVGIWLHFVSRMLGCPSRLIDPLVPVSEASAVPPCGLTGIGRPSFTPRGSALSPPPAVRASMPPRHGPQPVPTPPAPGLAPSGRSVRSCGSVCAPAPSRRCRATRRQRPQTRRRSRPIFILENACNQLICYDRFSQPFGEKPCEINAARWTLTPPV